MTCNAGMPVTVKWPFPVTEPVPRSWAAASKVVISAVGIFSKIWAEWLNKIYVHNKNGLHDAVEKRPSNQALVTVSNHRSCFDDPVLWGVLKWRHLVTNNEVMRWSLGASDICFTKEWHAKFFSYGRVVPICRGEGVYQKSMDFVLEKLNKGGWVHVFPEGRVNETNEYMRLKWGVGRLITECKVAPIVLPLWHVGMDEILPNRTPYIPHIGKRVTLVIGQPIQFDSLLKQLHNAKMSPMAIRKEVTDKIQEEFQRLKVYTERLHEEMVGRKT